jgi:hypothetical protein
MVWRLGTVFAMSAVELAIQKVENLNEAQALRLINWLQAVEGAPQKSDARLGARAMLGFARRVGSKARSTAEWMTELREGEDGAV